MKKYCLLSKYSLVIFYILVVFTFNACKKNIQETQIDGDPSKLNFIINGIEDPKNSLGKIATNTVLKNTTSTSNSTNSITAFGKVSLETSTASEAISTTFHKEKSRENKNLNGTEQSKLAAAKPLSNGTKYRIILYNLTTQNAEQIVDAVVGTPIEIDAVYGQTYEWYAYTFNSSTTITPIDPNNLNIETPEDQELLYDSGTVSTTIKNKPIEILFKHKLTQILFELDYTRLFGEMDSIRIEFVGDYLNKGIFSLRTGITTQITTYHKSFELKIDQDTTNIKYARFFIADPTDLTSFKVKINYMNIKYPNNSSQILIPEENPRVAEFNAFTPEIGKKLIGRIKFWYNFPERKILHATRYGAEIYGYAAQPYELTLNNFQSQNNKAAHNLLIEPRNFGDLTNSLVRSGGFIHDRATGSSNQPSIADKLNVSTIDKPDIILISVYYNMNESDISALLQYLNEGGVVILMTDGVISSDRNSQQPFFRQLFNNQSISLINSGYSAGAVYQFENINDEILNGPFGDIRLKHWGEDASPTTALQNVPNTEITQYSNAKPINGTTNALGVTMFKHNTKHFFWIGDGGFLSNSYSNGVVSSPTIEPFATVNTINGTLGYNNAQHPDPRYNYNNFPIPKKYGYSGNGIPVNSTWVYNSTLFANVISWAIINAEFFGIKTGGLL